MKGLPVGAAATRGHIFNRNKIIALNIFPKKTFELLEVKKFTISQLPVEVISVISQKLLIFFKFGKNK